MALCRDENGNIVVEMGCGDIAVSAGFRDNVDEDIAIVTFENQKKQSIGSLPKRGVCRFVDTEHIALSFTDKKSVDVVMEQLELCKEYL